MSQLVCIARGFRIPSFFVFDFDTDKEPNQRQNQTLLALVRDLIPEFPDEIESNVVQDHFACWACKYSGFNSCSSTRVAR